MSLPLQPVRIGEFPFVDFSEVLTKNYKWEENAYVYLPPCNQKLNEFCLRLINDISTNNELVDCKKEFPEFKYVDQETKFRLNFRVSEKIVEIFKQIYEIEIKFNYFGTPQDTHKRIITDIGLLNGESGYNGYTAKWSSLNPHLYANVRAPAPAAGVYASSTSKEHYQKLIKDLENPTGAWDVMFISGDKSLRAHRSWVSLHSEYFKNMLNGPMIEKTKREIPFPEDDPVAFEMMMHFMYHATVKEDASLGDYYLLRRLADKYVMPTLVELANARIHFTIQKITINKDNFGEYFEMVEAYGTPSLLDKCLLFIRTSQSFSMVEDIPEKYHANIIKHLLGKRINEKDGLGAPPESKKSKEATATK